MTISGRALLAFAVMVGIGLGLTVYRFAMQPIEWNGITKQVVELTGIGCIAGGSQLWRYRTEFKSVHVLSLVAGFAAAFGLAYALVPSPSRAALVEKALPGFTIALPSGDEKSVRLDYMAGQYKLANVVGTGDAVLVQWEPGTSLSREEVEAIGDGVSAAFGASKSGTTSRLPGPGGNLLDTMELSSPKGSIRISFDICGGRRIEIMTAGDHIQKLHERMLATIVCKPDPARETSLDAVAPIPLELPASWHRMDTEPGQVAYTDDTRVLLIKPLATPPDDVALSKLFDATLGKLGQNVKLGAKRDGRFPLTGTFDGVAAVGWLWPFECGSHAVLILGLAVDEAGASDLVTVFRNAQRCHDS